MYEHPWRQSGALWVLLCGAYIGIFGVYWLGNLAHLVMDMRSLIEARTSALLTCPCILTGDCTGERAVANITVTVRVQTRTGGIS